ncbi:hypothetical protein DPMN_186932 [Dreissena polymorpha]|uniref:Uncharacterized protein n=1 Tax=Dreissena polymorpha TaxID=45954 RepID=A0A9D4DN30_DREPO|nr:hypothetical protein DPMN_186932 [Dreissena polymorpha]
MFASLFNYVSETVFLTDWSVTSRRLCFSLIGPLRLGDCVSHRLVRYVSETVFLTDCSGDRVSH